MVENRIKEWRGARGWSLQQLADQARTSKGQIDKLEKGDRRLTVDWMVRLALALQCEPRDLLPQQTEHKEYWHHSSLSEDAPAEGPVAPASAGRFVIPPPDLRNLIPVRSAARGGNEQEMFLEDGPIDRVPRPYYLGEARDAYAIYVVGQSMVPMFRPGQIAFVNPHKPPTPGQGVVVTKHNSAVMIKELVKKSAGKITLREYQPKMRDFSLPATDIRDLHAIIGTAES